MKPQTASHAALRPGGRQDGQDVDDASACGIDALALEQHFGDGGGAAGNKEHSPVCPGDMDARVITREGAALGDDIQQRRVTRACATGPVSDVIESVNCFDRKSVSKLKIANWEWPAPVFFGTTEYYQASKKISITCASLMLFHAQSEREAFPGALQEFDCGGRCLFASSVALRPSEPGACASASLPDWAVTGGRVTGICGIRSHVRNF